MDFLVGKKWFHLIVNPGTAPSPLPDGTFRAEKRNEHAWTF